MTQVEICIATQSANTLPNPGAGNRWAYVLNHCEYTKRMGLKIQNILDFTGVEKRVPDIASVRWRIIGSKEVQPVTMDEPKQRWLFRLFRENAPVNMSDADVLRCYASSLTGHTAVTNHMGWDTIDENTNEYVYQDWNLGTGAGKKGWKLQPVIFHGALIKVKGNRFWHGNQWRVAFEVLDASNPETLTKTYKDNRWTINAAMSWNRMWLNGVPNTHDPRWPYGKGNPFPKLGDRDVPIPMLANGIDVGIIEEDWVRYLQPGDPFPSPYWENF